MARTFNRGGGHLAFTNPGKAKKFASTMINSAGLMKKFTSLGVQKAAIFLASETRKGIQAQAPGGEAFTPLAEATLKAKAPKTKALIDKADLLRSVQAHNLGGGSWLVGVHRNARGRKGESLANIAAIMEKGTKQQNSFAITSKAIKSVLKGGTANVGVVIPPRPYIEPTMRVNQKKVIQIVGDETFNGLFGKVG